MFIAGPDMRLGFRKPSAAGPFNGHATLSSGLVSYWKLDETSGVRVDSVTTTANDLTDTNTVTSGTGVSGNAALFTAANAEYLTRGPQTSLPEWSVSVWAFWKTNDMGAGRFIFERGTGWEFAENAAIYGVNATTARAHCGDGVSNKSQADVTPSLEAFNHFLASYDPATKKVSMRLNGAAAVVGSALSGTLYVGDTDINIGRSTALGGFYWNNLIDECGYWNRVLTTQEGTDLYNGGAGRFY